MNRPRGVRRCAVLCCRLAVRPQTAGSGLDVGSLLHYDVDRGSSATAKLIVNPEYADEKDEWIAVLQG